jgi:hypothetical protein
MSDKKTLTVKLVKQRGRHARRRTAPRCVASACASSTAARRWRTRPAVRGMINKVAYLVQVL